MKNRRKAAILSTLFVLLAGICVFAGLRWFAQQQQYALDGQLVTALDKRDATRALDLVNAGADPNTPYTALPQPSFQRMWDYLFHHSAIPPKESGPTAFVVACGGNVKENWVTYAGDINERPYTLLIEAMLKHGANIHALDANKTPPLICAAGYPEALRVLLAHGADVNTTLTNGSTALSLACGTGSFAGARLLLEHGANVNVNRDGGAQVMVDVMQFPAPRHDSAELFALLLAHGANPNATPVSGPGPTVLTCAQASSRPDIVALYKTGRSEEVTRDRRHAALIANR